jgi:ligand-binding SRPBCC domain-containing protein
MPIIELTTRIAAPIERVFDLSRDIDLHVRSTAHTGEQAVAGVTRGLIGLGEEVTWRAKHFGLWQHLTSRITQFERPYHFRDSMVAGAFRRIDHDHLFTTEDGQTVMRDVFDYNAPGGPLGRMIERLVLNDYLRRLLITRNAVIKAESEKLTS